MEKLERSQRAHAHNLQEYEVFSPQFNWEQERKQLTGLPQNKGLNIAYEAVERHANGGNADSIALRWIRKNWSVEDYSYTRLQKLSSRFANVLASLGIKKGERVFSLLGRVPELYISAIGTLKTTAV